MIIDHQVQLTILKELLFNPQARFAQLNSTELTNDHFTFHLKHLIDKGLVEKADGTYRLTPMGLEIAGRLDVKNLEFVKQPKVGISICVTRENGNEVLLGRRRKDPNKGQAGFFAEKVRFGESLFETAKRCLLNETGLLADFEFAGELHLLRKQNEEVVMDVVFSCFRAKKVTGELISKTIESENFWVAYDEAYELPDAFPDLKKDLDLYRAKKLFFEEIIFES